MKGLSGRETCAHRKGSKNGLRGRIGVKSENIQVSVLVLPLPSCISLGKSLKMVFPKLCTKAPQGTTVTSQVCLRIFKNLKTITLNEIHHLLDTT